MACVHISPRKTRENRSTHLPITPDCTFFNLRLNASGLAVSAHRFLSLRHRLASSPARIVADRFVTEPVPPPSSTASLLSILETGSWKRDVFPKGFSSRKGSLPERHSLQEEVLNTSSAYIDLLVYAVLIWRSGSRGARFQTPTKYLPPVCVSVLHPFTGPSNIRRPSLLCPTTTSTHFRGFPLALPTGPSPSDR